MAYSPDAVRAKLGSLNETQDSIVANAQWIMFHRRHAAATANLWLEKVHGSPPNKRLVLIYLANEVVQQSRARGKQDFLLAFEPIMIEGVGASYKGQSSETQNKIRRVVEVWRQRSVFDRKILEGVEAKMTELDKSKTSKSGGKLGGSLFGGPAANGAGAGNVPAELADVAKHQASLSKAEVTKTPALETAEKEYAKLTDPDATLPTPPVHAARLSALMRNLASAQGAVEASIAARRELLAGLEKLVESNKSKLGEEESTVENMRLRKEGVEAKKREVEDGIMRGLSSTPTSPTVGTPNSASAGVSQQNGDTPGTFVKDFATAVPEPAAPEAEGFTPPPDDSAPEMEGFTPPSAGEFLGTEDPGTNPTGADLLTEQPPNFEEPPPAFEPPPALQTGPSLNTTEAAAENFLNDLSTSMAAQQNQSMVRTASGEIPATSMNGYPGDPRLKRRKMSHQKSEAGVDRDIFGEGAGETGVDEDGISAMLAQ